MPAEQYTTKELVNRHGPAGGLILRLQRYGLLGWWLSALLFLVLMAYVFTDKIVGEPVLAVNEEGQILGHFEYLSAEARTDEEVIGAGTRFLRYYLSANSAFIMEDFTEALNMMTPELREAKLNEVLQTNYLKRIADANTISRLEFSKEFPPAVDARHELTANLRYRGNVLAQAGSEVVEKPFDISLAVAIIPRSSLATHGIKITAIEDN